MADLRETGASEAGAGLGEDGRGSFRAVKAAILARIGTGEWGPGALLPGEVDLAAAFGCARATVNRALGELAGEGILDRRRKAGTRVRLSPRREARFRIPVVRDEVAALGEAYRYTLVFRAVARAPDWLRGRMGLGPGDRVLHLVALHSAGPRAFQAEDRWISLAALPAAEAADFAGVPPTEWLVATVPWSEVEVSFLAAEADAAGAALLGIAPGRAVFVAERTTWWQDRPITHVRLTFAPGYRMTTRY
ncbi:MAG: UTRA domain-containing protein [Paracoccaceae bacterium]